MSHVDPDNVLRNMTDPQLDDHGATPQPPETVDRVEWRKHFGDRWAKIWDALGIPPSIEYNPVKPSARKFLTICRGGNVRSAALAFLLKYKYNCEAIAISMEKSTLYTRMTMYDWAETILVVDGQMYAQLPALHIHKARIIEIPQDIWANPLDIELLNLADAKLIQCGVV